MINKLSHRTKTILMRVILLHVCGLIFISYFGNWFGMRTPSVQEDKPKLQEIIDEKKGSKKKVEDVVKEQSKVINKVYLPKQNLLEEQKQENFRDERELDLLSEKHHLPERNEQENVVPEELEIQSEIKRESVVREDIEEPTLKHAALPEERKMTKENIGAKKKFDFTDYAANLINNYGIRDGEKVPLLLIDDHDKSGLYKTGLEFYGYQLIARPKVRPKEPYYFVINDLGMRRIDEICPYTGVLPSVLQEDRKLFERLLYQPQFSKMSNMGYELFYAPLDTRMLTLLRCKQKLILENARLDANDISKMVGTFKRVGRSYILIIESIVTSRGKCIKIYDPDNGIADVG
jgi:hypothetical protein